MSAPVLLHPVYVPARYFSIAYRYIPRTAPLAPKGKVRS